MVLPVRPRSSEGDRASSRGGERGLKRALKEGRREHEPERAQDGRERADLVGGSPAAGIPLVPDDEGAALPRLLPDGGLPRGGMAPLGELVARGVASGPRLRWNRLDAQGASLSIHARGRGRAAARGSRRRLRRVGGWGLGTVHEDPAAARRGPPGDARRLRDDQAGSRDREAHRIAGPGTGRGALRGRAVPARCLRRGPGGGRAPTGTGALPPARFERGRSPSSSDPEGPRGARVPTESGPGDGLAPERLQSLFVSPLSLDDWTLDDWKGDASLPVFAPERRDPEMRYLGLRCPCGGWIFRLTGWPRLAAGEGGYLLRTLVRVWREARQPMDAGEPEESPFLLPVQLECERCGRKGPLFEAPDRPDRVGPAGRAQPREAYRCRACRRGRIALVIGVAGVVAPGDPGGGATRRESEAASR